MIVKFGVRNCKSRGVLIESIDIGNEDVYFFKYQNQPMVGHCLQIQNIIRAANVKQSKKITVDITEFSHDYYDPASKIVWFKGIKLDSANQQINRTYNKRINIDTGAKKRMFTINDTKEAKAAAKKKKIEEKQAAVEEAFQKERARRIHELVSERKRQREAMECQSSNWIDGQ